MRRNAAAQFPRVPNHRAPSLIMSIRTEAAPPPRARSSRRRLVLWAIGLLIVGGIAYDTKVVTIGSEEDVQSDVFSPEAFGATEFPNIRANVEERAVDAQTLAAAIAADKAAASEQYGVPAGIGAVIPVSFTGVVGEGKSGVYAVAVEGLPEGLLVRVQTGPAINGTELRDATGAIEFGQFTNQIEYQNAGSALNNEMKAQVLASVDNAALTGKTVSVVGVFTLINPESWLVTPVRLEVQ
jgi:predicted lipoprotein